MTKQGRRGVATRTKAAGLFVLLGCAAALALVPRLIPAAIRGITSGNVEAIAPGMTYAEAEDLLGGPPGIHDPRVTVGSIPPGATRGKHRIGSYAAVYVCFDASGRVAERHVLTVRSRGGLERQRLRLGL